MSAVTAVWTDSQRNINPPFAALTNAHVPGVDAPFSIYKRRLQGGPREGVDVVEIDNGACQVRVLPTRGMGIWDARCGTLQLGWRAPRQGPTHPGYVPLMEPGGLGWLEGFDELICRCGLSSNGPPVFDGAGRLPHVLHGRIANIPAHKIALSVNPATREIALTGEVDESRLFFSKLRLTSTLLMKFGERSFTIRDTITNLSAERAEFALLYHANFGLPLLDEGAQVRLPFKTLVPRTDRAAEGLVDWHLYGKPQPGFTEQVYFFELLADRAGQTHVLLRNSHGHQGVSLRFDVRQLPCFIVWKCTQAVEDGYVTGLEPAVNFPNPRAFEMEQGRIPMLAPGASYTCELTLDLHDSAESVARAEEAVTRLQGTVTGKVYPRPLAGWVIDGQAQP